MPLNEETKPNQSNIHTGCCPEDLPKAMDNREEWREKVRDIRADGAI